MGLLERVEIGIRPMPPRIMIYGTPGVGKSTTAARAPNAAFVSTEDGLSQIDCHRFPLVTSYQDVIDTLQALGDEPHDYQTAVIDTIDWLETIIHKTVSKEHGDVPIEKIDGGYGRGYAYVNKRWSEIQDALTYLRNERNMMIILVAHAKVERFEDPEAAAYDRYSPNLHKAAAATLCQWCDAVLFATRKMRTSEEKGAFGKTRAIAKPIGADGGDRILRCIGGPACVAKNRYDLPAELPLNWDVLASYLFQQPNTNTNQPQVQGEVTNG